MEPSLAAQVSAIAHADLPHANPLSAAQIDEALRRVAACAPRTAIDIGCGPGSLAIRLAELCAAEVLAIDLNPFMLDRAIATARHATLLGTLDFSRADAASVAPQTFDAILCVGSSHALGAPRDALDWCRRALHPGGRLLFADLTWQAAPDAEFLDFLGVQESLYWRGTPREEGEVFASAGLEIECATRASVESFRAYEDGVYAGRLRAAATLPADVRGEVEARANAWRSAYLRHGAALGFTAYVARAIGA